MLEMAELRVGTSGWHYEHWKGVFYPAGMKGGERLAFYARHFDTVEIDNSFYRLPSRDTFLDWRRKTPAGFIFSLKASRFITHLKKLQEPREPLSSLFDHAGGLKEKLGPVLFQLPPRWGVDPGRLEEFVAALPAGKRHVFEFRDESWLREDIYRILEGAGCALCAASSPSFPSVRRATAGFAFLRFHGGETSCGSGYSRRELADWASYARSLLAEGRDVYAYFNNDAFGRAVEDARTFRDLAGHRPRPGGEGHDA